MQKIEATRKQQALMVCLMLVAVGFGFPLAMSGKACGVILWFVASILALAWVLTRISALAAPALGLHLLFAASFFVPVDVALIREQPFRISWVRCEVVGMRFSLEPARIAPVADFVIVRGCCPILGVEPSRVLKVCIP